MNTFVFSALEIDSLSDDEISSAFSRRDGRWSQTTKDLLRKFGTNRLDLNENWANQPQDWRCPACRRQKWQIARVTQKGVLFAKLELHHDHIHEHISNKLKSHFGNDWPKKIPKGTYELEHLGSLLIERFEKVVICADCNSADAEAKRQISGIHSDFSFRPEEIGQFICAKSNKPHEISMRKAIAIWQAQAHDFQLRLDLAGRLFDHMIRGEISRTANNHLERDLTATSHFRCELRNRTSDDLTKVYAALAQIRNKLKTRSISRP